MENIVIKDKEFEAYIKQEALEKRVHEIAQLIDQDYAQKFPLLMVVLDGAFRFASDLIKSLSIPLEITFVKVKSYRGTESQGEIEEILDIRTDLEGRHLLIIEDIVDTGLTLNYLINKVNLRCPASVALASLFLKPENFKNAYPIEYVGFEIPNDFIVGYGLDYDEQGRQLNDVYRLKPRSI